MGTVFSFDVRAPGVETSAIDAASDWLRWVDETFSTYLPGSVISRLGRGECARGEYASEVDEVLARCRQLEAETDGYFSMYASGRLDPSGLVKGWAIERASDMLVAAGSVNHCVNGGGDVQCAGGSAHGQAWRIGVAHPLRVREVAAVIVGNGLAVATSGSAERGAHVVDPHTGRAAGELASITVTGRRLGDTDAYATAAFAMGQAARDWVEALDGHEAFAVRPDGSTWSTTGWA
ncbi:MAG: FAD:protein FMN transferase [Actinomycetota bacterium]|nr:FAD:protein FMN transferase [Actinomycetota bacterium]